MSDRYAEFFLASRSDVLQLDCLEITHPNFTRAYRIIRNIVNEKAIEIRHENGELFTYDYYPIILKEERESDDLDQSINITFGDLGEIISTEIENVRKAEGFKTLVTVNYRIYRSDDLESPIYGPVRLVADAFSFDAENSTFKAKAPSLNINKTGERYLLERFPAQRGFL